MSWDALPSLEFAALLVAGVSALFAFARSLGKDTVLDILVGRRDFVAVATVTGMHAIVLAVALLSINGVGLFTDWLLRTQSGPEAAAFRLGRFAAEAMLVSIYVLVLVFQFVRFFSKREDGKRDPDA